MDKLRSKLFDENPNYSFSFDSGSVRHQSEDITDLNQLFDTGDSGGKLNFHDLKMPKEISPDMFKVLSRVMPAPVLDYETKLLEPITSVFADF